MGPCPCFPSVLPAPIPQLSGTGHCIVFSLQGGDGGASSSGNISVVAPATPAGGSRSSSRNLGSSGPEKEEGKKVRRQWESWSTEDKNTFFEGLYEVSCRHETKTHKQSSSWVLTVHLVFRAVVISFLGLLGWILFPKALNYVSAHFSPGVWPSSGPFLPWLCSDWFGRCAQVQKDKQIPVAIIQKIL